MRIPEHSCITKIACFSASQFDFMRRASQLTTLSLQLLTRLVTSRHDANMSMGKPGDVLEITVLKGQPREDEALLLLKKIASVSSLPASGSALSS